MLKLGGIAANGEVGLPFFVVMNEKGFALITSVRPVKGKPAGIGFPGEPEEISWFLDMLKRGAPALTAEEVRLVQDNVRRAND